MNRVSTEQFLLQLKANDVQVWLEGERLRVSMPKDAAIPGLREELAARKEEIVAFLKGVEKYGHDDEAVPPLVARGDASPVPLSYGQQRVWMLHELNKARSLTYDTLTWNLRIRGRLDTRVLHGSLDEVVRRHEVLRTVFRMEGPEPLQIVNPAAPVPLEEIDLRHLPQTERGDEAHRLMGEAQGYLFDLEQGPLFRTMLIRLDDVEWILVIILHHIVFDAWSMNILARELAELYEARAQGRRPALAELPIQYGDFAVWQRQWLQGEVLDRHLGYWRRELEGLDNLELPTDHPRPAVQTYNGARASIQLDSQLAAELIRLSRANGATSFMTMLTVLGILLYRYTGQPDVAVGTPITNRDRGEFERLIGFFLNTLVMRMDLSGDPCFDELLGRVRRTVVEGFSHQHLPFELLVDRLKVDRDPSRSPLFQVLFVLQNASDMEPLQLQDLDISPIATDSDTTRFDLEFYVYQGDDAFSVNCLYNTDLFDAGTIERLLAHFVNLLESVADSPTARLSELSLLDSEEWRRVVHEWNDTQVAYPGTACLHRLFERQAAATPEAVAVEFEDRWLSYAGLDRRANQLARRLRHAGVGPGSYVGVFMERSLEMVVGLYGILKAGGAYVPLDPEYPRERVAFMLEDTAPGVVLTQQALKVHLPEGGWQVLSLDSDWPEIAGQDDIVLEGGATLDDPAYAIYTSGSTGKPKGVVNAHAGIVNRLLWMQQAYGLAADDRVLQKTPFSFDVSVWEFFWPLLNGARLVVAKPGGHRDPAYLAELIARKGITTLHFVPSMLAGYLDHAELCGSVNRVICSGEALSGELQERFFRASDADLHNLYGPTEAAIDVTSWQCRRGENRSMVPIGRPVANTRIYILDRDMQPLPVGVAGELHIGGVQVALGYLNRPELTAERFVPDPFSEEPGARLYKSGDLARYLPDGTIEYLGRIDHQVKLRGFRIELGEIESALLEHEAVNAAVVVLHGGPGSNNPSLVAYVQAGTPAPPGTGEMREYLKRRLPEYMVPASITWLAAFPLTASGKIDRRALPEPVRILEREPGEAPAPSGELERTMARVWSELLEVDDVRATDMFFDLGGQSLLALKVISRFEEATGLRINLADVVGLSLREQVAALQPSQSGAVDPIAPLEPYRDGDEFPLSYAQERMWFLHELQPDVIAYNVETLITVECEHPDISAALHELAQRHVILRSTYRATETGPVQIIHDRQAPELDTVDLSHLDAREYATRLQQVAWSAVLKPFDLTAGPVWRAVSVRKQPRCYDIVLVLHHIATDARSMEVIRHELAQLCRGYAAGSTAGLPEPPIQYVDYAVWHRRWLDDRMQEQLDYWARKLDGIPSVMGLPTDRPRPAVYSYRGSYSVTAIEGSLFSGLRALAQQRGVTPFMLLLAVFKVLLSRYARQDDIIVGTPVSGRTRVETENVVGLFVNTLVQRTKVSGDLPFVEFLQSVRGTTLDAFRHQDVPFEKIVEVVEPERDLSRNPVFQVMFNLLRASEDAESIQVDVEKIIQSSDAGGAQVDLTLHAYEEKEQLYLCMTYSTDLFDSDTINRMLGHYRTLLRAVVANPEQIVARLPMLDSEEENLLLRQWNQKKAEYAVPETVHRLFEIQAERTPDAVAVECAGEELSYRSLNARANRLAQHLRHKGVGAEVRVGLFVERSPDLLVAILAILKAGGTYVPMDPAYPLQRIGFMLTDSAAPLLLTQQGLGDRLPDYAGEVVCLDRDRAEIDTWPAENPEEGGSADDSAYVIYTSGSTGEPKGVVVSHANVTRLFAATRGWYHMGADDVWTLFHSCAFDFSVWEIWGALLHGGRLVVVPYEVSRSPELFHNLLANAGVTVLNQTPSAFRQLITVDESRDPDALRSLRLVIFGGEALDPQMLKPWFDRHGDSRPRMVNMYGITETTVHVTYRPITASQAETPGSVIGSVIPDLELYILDPYRQPVPIGVPGEMYIGGAGVAKGYLNREQLTQERFIPHPFSDQPGARLYRTGDLARYLAGGDIEYLGRIDHQVKLRGFRIELGEIEAVLSDHEGVRGAVAIVREDAPGDRRLVAYAVPAAQAAPSIAELRDMMKARLPDYMVPSTVVWLDEIPLNASGKVDRRALPEPDDAQGGAQSAAPRNEMERCIAEIWCTVLQRDAVGVQDDFFDLGGHSLLALQVVSRLRDQLDIQLTIAEFMRLATVEGIAALAEDAGRTGVPERVPAPPLKARGDEVAAPLSFGQERVWMLHEFNKGRALNYDTLAWSLRIKGHLDVGALRRALDEIVRRHEVLRTTFHMGEEGPVQVINPAAPVPVEEFDLRDPGGKVAHDEARGLMEEVKDAVFDLEQGPLFRARLIRLKGDEWIFVIMLHHIVFDAWSMTVLMQELAWLYERYEDDLEPALPELPVQYGDFALWQRQWLQGDVLEAHLDYWRRHLEDLETLRLPLDRRRPPVQTYNGATESMQVSDELAHELSRLARSSGVTPFMMMLSALGVLLFRYTGQSDVAIGTPITNRDREELERLIGYFLNTLVMRVNLSGDPAFSDLLGQVRRMVLDGFSHQHLPFEVLVDKLKVSRDPSRSPLFQVLFVLQTESEAAPLSFKGLDVSPIPMTGDIARFDLEFYVHWREAGCSIGCTYNTDLFEAATIQRMLGHFGNLLDAIAADPAQPLSGLPLLGEEERRQILVDWNATSRTRSDAVCVHQLIESQAQTTPDAVAVADDTVALTYAELDDRAGRLARRLRRAGVQPGDLVGICVDRGAGVAVGLLGILKAGAAYLPLDAGHPRERLAFMLQDSRSGVVVADDYGRDSLPQEIRTVALGGDPQAVSGEEEAIEPVAVAPESRAYVIYTSGSTGRPKGVQVSHGAVVNFLRSMARRPGVTREDILLAVTTVSFDIHVLEIFMPLIAGARVHVADREATADGRQLLALLRRTQATIMQATPTTWRMLIESGWSEQGSLKVLCGGEPLPMDLARQLLGRCGELWNMYGPTETTVWSSVFRVDESASAILVGRPIDDTRFYILDRDMEPVPVGVTGELYIGGAGVADGYINRPELTAERFVADPFVENDHGRLYRTGDLARYRPDGNVELLGRADHQVKLRGFRIELGEIEAVLDEHPAVAAAVAVVREDGDRGRLVAYATPSSASRPETSDLREFIRGRLPGYMVPAIIMWLDEFPLTASGKIDRKALPVPRRQIEGHIEEDLAPSGALEAVMATIWSEVLDIDDIQADDTFFDLGGDSLLSLRVVERFERETGIYMTPVELVNQTLRQVAAGLEARGAERDHAAEGGRGWLHSIKAAFSKGT